MKIISPKTSGSDLDSALSIKEGTVFTGTVVWGGMYYPGVFLKLKAHLVSLETHLLLNAEGIPPVVVKEYVPYLNAVLVLEPEEK